LLGVARWYRRPPGERFVLVEASQHGWWYSAPVGGSELVALFVTDPGIDASRATQSEVWRY
jgi:hypothetical protein